VTARGADPFPGFERAVPAGGYAWWYVDALSDDGRHGLTVIAFIGNVFSPWYARARRRGDAEAADHCALNVALYGAGRKRWALTERGRDALERDRTHLRLGPSLLWWTGDALVIEVEEITVPLPSRIRGRITVRPAALTEHGVALDAAGRHRWWPVAPLARVEVAMRAPRLAWSGDGYLDCNAGDEPLERGFRAWSWSRGTLDGGAVILYDAERRDGSREPLGLRADRRGRLQPFEPPPPVRLAATPVWRFPRETRSEDPAHARVGRTLEDTPFYARSVLHTRLLGSEVRAVHESLSLERFDRAWVQALLPFRLPRRAAR